MLPKRSIGRRFSTLALVISLGLPAVAHAAEPTFAVMPVVFDGELTPAVKAICTERLALGLRATGATVKDGPQVAALLPADEACDDACRKKVASSLQADYVVGATVKGEDRFYDLTLWLAGAQSGAISVRLERKCHVCSLTALASSMDLAASALRAKVKKEEPKPGEISVSTEPAGAAIEVDGEPLGNAPKKLKLKAGEHEIVAKLEGYLAARKKLTVIAGSEEVVTLNLVAAPKAGGLSGKTRRILGWTGVGVGAAAIIAGIVLMAVDGNPTCDESIPGLKCRKVYDTVAGAAVSLGVGAALAGAGSYLLFTGRNRAERNVKAPQRRLTISPLPNGVALSLHGTL